MVAFWFESSGVHGFSGVSDGRSDLSGRYTIHEEPRSA